MTDFIGSKKFISVAFLIYGILIIPIANFLFSLGSQLLDIFLALLGQDKIDFTKALSINRDSFFVFQAQGDGLFFYGVICVVMLYGFVKFAYHMRRSFGQILKNQYGDNKFTELKDLKKQYRAVPESKKSFKGQGGVPISHINYPINKFHNILKEKNIPLYKMIPSIQEKFLIDDSPVNNLIIGTTRSGKGQTFVIPTIDIYSRAEKQSSMIINDPKGGTTRS